MEIIPPAPDGGVSPEPENLWNGPAQEQWPPEQFDSVMGRTLARSSRDASDDSDSSEELPSGKDKPHRTRMADSTNSPQTACADNPAAQVAPLAVPPSDSSQPRSEMNPSAEAVSASGQTPPLLSTISKDTAAAGSSLPVNGLSHVVSSSAEQPQPSTTGSFEPGVSGLKTRLENEPVAASEQTAGSERLLIPLSGKGALETQRIDSAGTPAGTGKLSVPASSSPGSTEIAGISSAPPQVPMQKAEKMDEFSASAEQNLPAPPAGVTGEELPARITRSVNSPPHQEKSEPTSATDSSVSGITSPAETVSSAARSSPWPSETPVRSLERAHDLMSLHAFRLRDSGADSLEVVIKPGLGLQLSLNLQMRNGTVDMQATLHRGDFDFMNRHWSELQQQLESRGIRLAPLLCSEQAPGGGQNLFQQSGRQKQEEDTVQPRAFAPFALTSALKPAATIKTMKTPRGWESWA